MGLTVAIFILKLIALKVFGYFMVTLPSKLQKTTKAIYYGLILTFWVWFVLFRLRGSAKKLDYDLDNFFVGDREFRNRYPNYPHEFKTKAESNKICRFSSPKVSWEWALNGLSAPVHFFDQKCTSRQYHIFKNYEIYTKKLDAKKGSNFITFENVDNILYPEKWDHLALKIMNTNQEIVLASTQAKTEQELVGDQQDIKVDFS